jgi:hypothetical protein
MPGTRKVCWLGLALLALAGCHSTDPDVKPKNVVEEYMMPPDNDSRYNSVQMTYPPNTLFEDVLQKDAAKDAGKPKDRFGPMGQGIMPGGY